MNFNVFSVPALHDPRIPPGYDLALLTKKEGEKHNLTLPYDVWIFREKYGEFHCEVYRGNNEEFPPIETLHLWAQALAEASHKEPHTVN